MPSDAAPSAATRRLHQWSVLFLAAGQLRQFAVPVVIALVLGSQSREAAWQAYALPLMIPYALFVVVRYWTFNYTFGDNELVTDDSRVYGPAQIVGRVVCRYWPYPRMLTSSRSV